MNKHRASRKAQTSTNPAWGAFAGGVALGLLLVAALGVWLYSSRQAVAPAPQPVVADQPAAEQPIAAASEPAASAPIETPLVETPAVDPPTVAAPQEQPAPKLVPVQLDPRVLAYTLPTATWTATYDPLQGRIVFASDLHGFLFYSLDSLLAANPQPDHILPVVGQPVEVRFKQWKDRGFILTSETGTPGIRVFDAGTFEELAHIALGERAFSHCLAAADNTDDPYVYFVRHIPANDDIYGGPQAGGRIDLSTLQLERTFPEKTQILDMAISADGEVIYYRQPHYPMGVRVVEWAENPEKSGELLFKPLFSAHRDTPQYIPLSDRPGVAAGRRLYDKTMENQLAVLRLEPRAFFKQRPLVAGVGEQSLKLASSNDYSELVDIPLPVAWFPERSNLPNRLEDPRQRRQSFEDFRGLFMFMAADDARGVLATVLNHHLVVVPVDRLGLAAEPSLAVDVDAPREWFVGVEQKLPLEVPTEEVTYSIKDYRWRLRSDAGAQPPQLNGNVFSWTPTRDHVGDQDVTIELRRGDSSHEVKWKFTVKFPYVSLPWKADGLSFDASGKRLVVWNRQEPSPAPGADPSEVSDLAVIDVATRAITAQRTFDRLIHWAAIDDSGVYTVWGARRHEPLEGSNQLIRYDVDTLEPRDQALVNAKVQFLQVIGGRYLLLQGLPTLRMSLPKLDLIEPPIRPAAIPPAGRTREGWLWNGVLWDDKLRKRRLLVTPCRRVIHPFNSDEAVSTPRGSIAQQANGWQVCNWIPPGLQAERPGRESVHHLIYNSLDYPGLVQGRQGPDGSHAVVEIKGLGAGSNVSDTLPLDRDARRGEGTTYVAGAPGVIAVANEYRLYIVPHESFRLRPPQEFQLEPQQSTLVLDFSGKSAVTYEAPGATNYQLQLHTRLEQPPVVTQASENGRFSLDLEQMHERLLDSVGSSYKSWVGNPQVNVDRDFKSYVDAAQDEYREVTGKKCRGVPALIWATVIATSAENQVDGLVHYYFTDIPLERVRERLKIE